MTLNLFQLIGMTISSLALNAMGIIAPPFGRVNQQEWNRLIPNEILDIQTNMDLKTKGLIEDSTYHLFCDLNGYDWDTAELVRQNTINFLNPMDYVTLFRRGLISKEYLISRLKLLKFGEYTTEEMLQATEYLPSPQDLITWAVREVFSPEISERFGQYEDFPEDFAREAAKLGMSEETAKRYWAAHWGLPSMTQGYEMFHRGIIEKEDLALLMKSQDIMPFWRDNLMKLSYNPLTRVDIRRMFGTGVLGVEGVYKAYKDNGYSPENAELLTEFTVKHEDNEFDGLTKAKVVSAFVDDIITLDELLEMLKGLGMSERAIQFTIEVAQYDKVISEIKAEAQELSDRFQMGIIDIQGVRQGLANIDVPTQFIEGVINKLIKKQAVRSKVADKVDLVKWYSLGAIDDNMFIKQMRGQGYTNDAIQAYMSAAQIETGGVKRKFLDIKTYQKWLTSELMTQDEFVNTLTEMGVAATDIAKLMEG